MKRENGYYWIKLPLQQKWEVALFCEGFWWITGSEDYIDEKHHKIEIDENRIIQAK